MVRIPSPNPIIWAAAVSRYNIFLRVVSTVVTSFFGLPGVNYFDDDFGCHLPDSLGTRGVWIFREFSHLVGVILEKRKTDVGLLAEK